MISAPKIYVLDTSVIVSDPEAILKFQEHHVVLAISTIEELDGLKKGQNDTGRNARHALRLLDQLISEERVGAPKVGRDKFVNDQKGTLEIALLDSSNKEELPCELDFSIMDNRILSVAIQQGGILVSNDINLRIKATAVGLKAEAYENGKVEIDDLYTGITDSVEDTLYPNQYVQFKDKDGNVERAARYDADLGMLVPIREDLESWGLSPANEEQRYAMDLLLNDNIKLVTLVGKAGSGKTVVSLGAGLRKVTDDFVYKKLSVSRPVMPMGKDVGYLPGPQPLDAKVLTPNGWTTMGEIKEGSYVITQKGTPAKVLKVYPKGIKPVFKVTTTDETYTECCEDHLWFTTTSENRKRNKLGSVKSTKDIKDTIINKFGKLNHHIPRNLPVYFEENGLPLSPYVLGVILGDGSISDSISFTSIDSDIVQKVRREVEPLGCLVSNVHNTISYNISANLLNNKPGKSVRLEELNTGSVFIYDTIGIALSRLPVERGCLNNRCASNSTVDGIRYSFIDDAPRWQNPMKDIIHSLGLTGTLAHTKFIPDLYKYGASIESRLELLRGLMDTDGTVKTIGEAMYCTTSLQLAKDIVEVVQSLGGRAVIHSRDRRGKQTICGGRTITSRLISYEFDISLPEGMNPFYLPRKAGRFKSAYTHGVGVLSIEPAGEKEVQCILIDDPDHLYITDGFMVTHNTIEEKMSPYMQPIVDNVEFLMQGYKSPPVPKVRGKKKNKEEVDKEDGILPKGYHELVAAGILEMEAITFIRGRSIPNQIMLFDEVQNMTPHEMFTVVSRAGENTKMIFVGDVNQIDNPYLDATNNGLTFLIERMKGEKIAGHVTLKECERSELAEVASRVLQP